MKHLHVFGGFLLSAIFSINQVFSQEIHTQSNAASIANESNFLNVWVIANSGTSLSVETNGVELGEMNKLLLEKIEELTLYVIQQNKKNNSQQLEIELLQKQIAQLKNKD